MSTTILIFALVAALFHLLAFTLESLLFMRPTVHKRFNARTPEEAQATRLFAFNQGFYNLFLTIGCLLGLWLWHQGNITVGSTLVLFTCASMLGAAMVLLYSSPKMLRVALYQGLPPAIVIGSYLWG